MSVSQQQTDQKEPRRDSFRPQYQIQSNSGNVIRRTNNTDVKIDIKNLGYQSQNNFNRWNKQTNKQTKEAKKQIFWQTSISTEDQSEAKT